MNSTRVTFGTLALALLIVLYPTRGATQSSGKTANGCTYEVVNGKYYYNCPEAKAADVAAPASAAPATVAVAIAEAPPAAAQAISAPNSSYYPQEPKGPAEVVSPTLPRNSREYSTLRGKANPFPVDPRAEDGPEASFGEMTYAGISLGSTNFLNTETLKGATTAYGVQVGTNVNEYLGIELGYSYAKTEAYLGLEQRSNGRVVTPFTRARQASAAGQAGDPNPPLENVDTTLTAHLINMEGQFHLTKAKARFRPYAGVGLGYKASNLQENFPVGTTGAANASVAQGSLGATAGIGAKFRVSESIQVAAAFRFFIPVSTSEPEWSTQPTPPRSAGPGAAANAQGGDPSAAAQYNNSRAQNLYQGSDTKLTSSALSQIAATVQYIF